MATAKLKLAKVDDAPAPAGAADAKVRAVLSWVVLCESLGGLARALLDEPASPAADPVATLLGIRAAHPGLLKTAEDTLDFLLGYVREVGMGAGALLEQYWADRQGAAPAGAAPAGPVPFAYEPPATRASRRPSPATEPKAEPAAEPKAGEKPPRKRLSRPEQARALAKANAANAPLPGQGELFEAADADAPSPPPCRPRAARRAGVPRGRPGDVRDGRREEEDLLRPGRRGRGAPAGRGVRPRRLLGRRPGGPVHARGRRRRRMTTARGPRPGPRPPSSCRSSSPRRTPRGSAAGSARRSRR